jgi:hypothetical protein
MKKIILLFIFPLIGIAQINKVENNNGFKTYMFGDSPDKYKNLILEIDENNTKLYSLPEDNITVEGVAFEYIRVTFSKNKLSTIAVQTKNATGSNLFNELKKNYGEPSKTNYSKKVSEWMLSGMKVIYEKSSSDKDAVISFYSKVN